ncbi:MAG: (Fe-S)-binding protein [Candidatus Eisenbacteria sp.]|nr:(Fe-S)-binding protein [Candidatus Eisenbacteria bacterium]
MESVIQSIRSSRAYSCLECGKCTASCPIARFNGAFSPRRVVAEAIERGGGEHLLADELLWECLTCGICELRCPTDVHFGALVRSLRAAAVERGFAGHPSHGGVLQSLMRMMTSPTLKQDRMWWVTEDLEVESRGEILYFVGCLPYFDDLFAPDLNLRSTDIARSTVQLLNAAGIKPVVDSNERCCGHDLLWTGDVENFRRLAEHNVAAIRETGATVVVTACAECAKTLRDVYPEWVGPLGFEVKHLSSLIVEHASSFRFKENTGKVTFQDPCRLSRHMGEVAAPRQAMGLVPGLELVEMLHSGVNAVCCGTSAWTNCGQTSRSIQAERLQEAGSTGAATLVTACPKCQIHFRCALSDGRADAENNMNIQDLSVLLASCL